MIKDPGLDCNSCYKRWREDDVKPLCKQKGGCPIESLAIDPKLKRRVQLFNTYRSLTIIEAPEVQRIKVLKKADLFDNPSLLIQAEIISRRSENLKAEREKRKNGNRRKR